MKNLILAIEAYLDICELQELGLKDEEVAGFIDFFFCAEEMEFIN